MVKLTEIAWLGGLLEGEGCFCMQNKIYPLISLSMTSEDAVTKAANLMRSKVYRRGSLWIARTTGAHAISWMMTLYPYLDRIRRESITSIVKIWKEHTYVQAPNGVCLMATCHPDRLAIGSDQLCKVCHVREYKARKYREKKLLRMAVQ